MAKKESFPSLASLKETFLSPTLRGLDLTPTPASRSLHDDTMLTSPRDDPDHVLRSTFSSDPSLNRNKRSTSIITNPYEGYERPPTDDLLFRNKGRVRSGRQSRYSPTSSMKRGKAERLLKEHGSPPGIRVTAGGRIVPDGLPQLSSTRFNSSAGQGKYATHSAYPRLIPEYMANSAALHQLNNCIVEVGNGMLCQVIDGQLRQVGFAGSPLTLYAPPADGASAAAMSHLAAFNTQTSLYPGSYQAPMSATMPPTPQSPFAPSENFPVNASGPMEGPTLKQLRVLEGVHAQLEADLKALDRNEVLNRAALTSANKADIVRQRVELTNRLDESRRSIISMKEVLGLKSPTDMGSAKQPSRASVKPFVAGQSTGYQNFPMTPVTPYYFNGQSTFPPLDSSDVENAQYPGFMPVWPQYEQSFTQPIPQFASTEANMFQPFEAQTSHMNGNQLQQRPVNVGLGIKEGGAKPSAVNASVKQMQPPAAGSINLDGVAHQPRRSHALQIKDPNNTVKQSALDPASPVYQPRSATASKHQPGQPSADLSDCVPSSALTALVDNLVSSPPQHGHPVLTIGDKGRGHSRHDDSRFHGDGTEGTDESGGFQTSGSSATTGDFFPHDTHHHSANKYSFNARDNTTDLSAWMRNRGEADTSEHATTPLRAPTKFVFGDSPDDKGPLLSNAEDIKLVQAGTEGFSQSSGGSTVTYSPKREKSEGSSKPTFDVDCANPSDNNATTTAVSTPRKHRPANIITPKSLHTTGIQPSARHMPTPSESEAYLAGYALGFRQELVGDSTNAEYRQGYRDGLIHACTHPKSSSSTSSKTHPSQSDMRATHGDRTKVGPSPFHLSRSRTSSMQPVAMPGVPDNSYANSPENQSYDENIDESPSKHTKGGSTPSGRFSMELRQMGTQTSSHGSRSHQGDQASPLAKQYSGNQIRNPGQGGSTHNKKDDQVSIRTSAQPSTFEQQRYPAKSKTSVASSSNHARGWFPQYDGSAEDDEDDQKLGAGRDPSPAQSPTKPSGLNKGKGKASARSSPVKQVSRSSSPAKKASAAVAKLTGMSNPKHTRDVFSDSEQSVNTSASEKDPAKMSSPEKANWRAKWNKRFEDIKKKEQKEIDEYKKNNPLPPHGRHS
ncbi:MAG: hypothetical protein M1828_000618 [Chrysothrix sp. TS-e1954]|nr:MAG: hypothetical protein M1828_000618 [Chrysothrix sp. TS-e1954]